MLLFWYSIDYTLLETKTNQRTNNSDINEHTLKYKLMVTFVALLYTLKKCNMASVRELKKDINFLASELITEAYVKQLVKEDVDNDKIAEVMVKAIEFRNGLVARANHPDGKDNPKMVKAFYQKLRKDMMEQFLSISKDTNAL